MQHLVKLVLTVASWQATRLFAFALILGLLLASLLWMPEPWSAKFRLSEAPSEAIWFISVAFIVCCVLFVVNVTVSATSAMARLAIANIRKRSSVAAGRKLIVASATKSRLMLRRIYDARGIEYHNYEMAVHNEVIQAMISDRLLERAKSPLRSQAGVYRIRQDVFDAIAEDPTVLGSD